MSLNRFKNNFKMLLFVTISLTLKTLATTRQGLLSVGSAQSKLLPFFSVNFTADQSLTRRHQKTSYQIPTETKI